MRVTVHDVEVRTAVEQVREYGVLREAVDPLQQRDQESSGRMMLRK